MSFKKSSCPSVCFGTRAVVEESAAGAAALEAAGATFLGAGGRGPGLHAETAGGGGAGSRLRRRGEERRGGAGRDDGRAGEGRRVVHVGTLAPRRRVLVRRKVPGERGLVRGPAERALDRRSGVRGEHRLGPALRAAFAAPHKRVPAAGERVAQLGRVGAKIGEHASVAHGHLHVDTVPAREIDAESKLLARPERGEPVGGLLDALDQTKRGDGGRLGGRLGVGARPRSTNRELRSGGRGLRRRQDRRDGLGLRRDDAGRRGDGRLGGEIAVHDGNPFCLFHAIRFIRIGNQLAC